MWPRSNLHSRPEISGDPYNSPLAVDLDHGKCRFDPLGDAEPAICGHRRKLNHTPFELGGPRGHLVPTTHRLLWRSGHPQASRCGGCRQSVRRCQRAEPGQSSPVWRSSRHSPCRTRSDADLRSEVVEVERHGSNPCINGPAARALDRPGVRPPCEQGRQRTDRGATPDFAPSPEGVIGRSHDTVRD